MNTIEMKALSTSETVTQKEIKIHKLLSKGKLKTGGRNNLGRITAFHRGGGNKIRYRQIENLSRESLTKSSGELTLMGYMKGKVLKIERDPNRTAFIALIEWKTEQSKAERDGALNSSEDTYLVTPCAKINSPVEVYSEYSYVLAPVGLTVGQSVYAKRKLKYNPFLVEGKLDLDYLSIKPTAHTEVKKNQGVIDLSTETYMHSGSHLKAVEVGTSLEVNTLVGKLFKLKDLAYGTKVYNIDGKYLRAAGVSGIVINSTTKTVVNTLDKSTTITKLEKEKLQVDVTVRLQSGEYKVFNGNLLASVGSVSNPENRSRELKKAGQSRWLGRRPTVRGVAMNPVDHPHGGGEGKSSGGRPSVTPWGKPARGKPTRSKAKPRLVFAA